MGYGVVRIGPLHFLATKPNCVKWQVFWVCIFCMFQVHVLFCFFVCGCQYHFSQLPGKTRLRNNLLCVEWVVKPYSLTHSLSEVYSSCSSVPRASNKLGD